MRKLKLQMQLTVDGFVSGTNGEMDWIVFNWGDDIKNYVTAITDAVDCILLGRKLAEGFIPHWASIPEGEDKSAIQKMNDTYKVVFTKTLDKSDPVVAGWKNTDLAKGELADEINKLKNKTGGDMVVYGGGSFVSSLIKAGLIDEYHLFINPTAIGNGMTIFKSLNKKQNLALKKSIAFDCGIVLLCYETKRE